MNISVTVATALASVLFAASAFWIEAKAVVGQVLMERAWQYSLANDNKNKPWPWADTWPVAKLTIPALDMSLVVLEGVTGEAMAFGPGRIAGLSTSATTGTFAIGGHRDSHLSFMQHLQNKDSIQLQTVDGKTQQFRVSSMFVADSTKQDLQVDANQHALILITCYPFNALQTGGPQRFVVVAKPVY